MSQVHGDSKGVLTARARLTAEPERPSSAVRYSLALIACLSLLPDPWILIGRNTELHVVHIVGTVAFLFGLLKPTTESRCLWLAMSAPAVVTSALYLTTQVNASETFHASLQYIFCH
jgi:hypothetical protein